MERFSSLRYTDETDRAYGVAGMTIALKLLDGEAYLDSVSIERPVGRSVAFTPAFGFIGNPRLMASLAWREHLSQFRLAAAMIMGNALCRAYIGRSTPLTAEATAALRSVVGDEGRERCSLDEDEIDIIYNRIRRYLERVFTHTAVSPAAHDFVNRLTAQRNLTASEALDILSVLDRL